MRSALFVLPLAAALTLAAATAWGGSSCGGECVADYRADVSFCQTITGDDPADYDPACVRYACYDYHACLDDCSDPLGFDIH